MFLELSSDSRNVDKNASTSKSTRSWRHEREESQEMSLDDLISDFQQTATSRRLKLNSSQSSSDDSSLRIATPPRHSTDKKSWSFADRARQEPSQKRPIQCTRDSCSSDDDAPVTPMPRIDQILKNRPSFALKRRIPVTTTSTRSNQMPVQRRVKPPVLSSPSLTPQSLSPITFSSVASSSLSVSENNTSPPDKDSIDALIGKDIRDLNKLISTGSRQTRKGKKVVLKHSPTADEMSSVLRQSTRFQKMIKESRLLPLGLKVPSRKARSVAPDSPPPPPPPEDDDSEDEEDSFAEEIQKLRESRRFNTLSYKTTQPQQEAVKEDIKFESSEICTTTALKVRNASNAISDLLLAALKPFEDRIREEEKLQAIELEDEADGAIQKAATAKLQYVTQTIVSQLDLTFADMTERRKADLKAEADVAAAVKESEKKEKETTETKRKTEEKETKEREMEILRLIPLQGKLLTCSADIENVLEELENTADEKKLLTDSKSSMEAEIKALRNHTKLRIQEIETQMSAAPLKTGASDKTEGISWQAVDWVQDNVDVDHTSSTESNDQFVVKTESLETEAETVDEEESGYLNILQQEVLEKLDLTMLKLKHVLSIDTKETAENHEKQQQEIAEKNKLLAQQQLEDERRQREQEDADNARRRVMGLTTVDDVEGWIEDGRQLQSGLGQDLNRLIASLDANMEAESVKTPILYWRETPSNQEEGLRHFDQLMTMMTTQNSPQLNNQVMDKHSDYRPDNKQEYWRQTLKARHIKKSLWEDLPRSLTREDEDESDSSGGSDTDENLSTHWVAHQHQSQNSTRRAIPNHRSVPSISRSTPQNPDKQRRKRVDDHGCKKNDYKHYNSASTSSESKHWRRMRDIGEFQQDVARTIHALQTERRQKTWWIQSYSPTRGRRIVK